MRMLVHEPYFEYESPNKIAKHVLSNNNGEKKQIELRPFSGGL